MGYVEKLEVFHILFLFARGNFGLRKPRSSEIVPNLVRNIHSGAKKYARQRKGLLYYYISLPLFSSLSFLFVPVPSLFVIPLRAPIFFPARTAFGLYRRATLAPESSTPAPNAVERSASEYYCSCCLLVESSSGFFCRIAWNHTQTFGRVRLSYLVSVRLRSIF